MVFESVRGVFQFLSSYLDWRDTLTPPSPPLPMLPLCHLPCTSMTRRCPSAIPKVSFDTTNKSDEEVMQMLGMDKGEDMRAFLSRTKGLIVLMAAVMQVRCCALSSGPDTVAAYCSCRNTEATVV